MTPELLGLLLTWVLLLGLGLVLVAFEGRIIKLHNRLIDLHTEFKRLEREFRDADL